MLKKMYLYRCQPAGEVSENPSTAILSDPFLFSQKLPPGKICREMSREEKRTKQ
jgi:hypothetical protein